MVPSNLHDHILGWRNESAPTLCWHVILHNPTKEYCKNEFAAGCEGAISLKFFIKKITFAMGYLSMYCWPYFSFSIEQPALWLFTVQSMSIVMENF